jgi:hypothetical protein
VKWSVRGGPGGDVLGFIVLLLTIIEAYDDLFSRTFAIPGIGHWAAIGWNFSAFSASSIRSISSIPTTRSTCGTASVLKRARSRWARSCRALTVSPANLR